MIRITHTGVIPAFYQTDRSYNLPSTTGAVQWNGTLKCFEVSIGNSWQRIDPIVELHSNLDVHAMHAWIEEQKRKQVEEKELRSQYPALDEAYNHLELIKALVKDHTENKTTV